MVEPIQGEGGVRVPSDDYLNKLRELCDKNGWLLILDEIQTGSGRTGKYFAYQNNGILPDVVTVAKGLANGCPIGACIARGEAANILQPGTHGSTFGGNPMACAAGLATLNFIQDNNLLERVITLGDNIRNGVQQNLEGSDTLVEVRGQGLLIGFELNKDCGHLVEEAKKQGLMINVTAGNTVRLLPPFILSDEQASEIVSIVTTLIENA
jgi:acetylornithine aminotransferase